MTRLRLWLLLAAVCLTAAATAAPIPENIPPGQGPISDYLLMRGTLPSNEPPLATRAVVRGDTLDLETTAIEYRPLVTEKLMKVQAVVDVAEVRERVVNRGGQEVKEKFTVVVKQMREVEEKVPYTTIISVPVPRKVTAALKDCRFFVVTREGKLEALEVGAAAKKLAEAMSVLSGTRAEIDPRHLEVVKPGTLYLVTPPSTMVPVVPVAPERVPPPPIRKEKK